MSGTLDKLKKLKGRSLHEMRVRGAQAAHAFAERVGWSSQCRVPDDAAFFRLVDARELDGARPSAETLLAHFRSRRRTFFASFDDAEATEAELQQRILSRDADALIRRAERIMSGRFDLLGLSDLSFGQPVDWHLEPVSDKRAPLKHWSRINYLDAGVAGDKKIIWELNRQQHFMVLGRAYWHTRDERYAEACTTQLASWMDANPSKLGINWTSSLEVALRSISWLWALHFFRDSRHLTPQLHLRVLKYLYLHARHLETYLSTYFSPNTHLTGEALGLFYLGTALPQLRTSTRWRDTGRRVLLDELERQVRADGVYFEQATYYHRYTADFYTHFYLLARASEEPVETLLKERLCALFDFLMYATRPDGTTPLFGDDDGGRLAQLGERAPDDFRGTLATAAALFGRGDYKYVSGDGEASEETLWLLGREGARAFTRLAAQPPLCASRAFPDGGFYVMRDGWRRDSNYMLIDCGPHGSLSCGHAHADVLSFDLAARGRTRLVDPGTYTYTGSTEERDYFRGSTAHNVLVVDGESSSVPDKAFTWRHVAQCDTRAWTSGTRFDYFEGAHDGYARLTAPAIVARGVLFLKGDYWVVRDRVETEGAHRYESFFHFAPGTEASVEAEGETFVVRETHGDNSTPEAHTTTLEIHAPQRDGKWRTEQGWVSRCYASRARAPVFVRECEGTGAQEFVSFLVPVETKETPLRVSEIEAVGGRAFELERATERDLLLVGDGSRMVETARLSSNFAWAWARFREDARAPAEFVLIGGNKFELDGGVVVSAGASRVGYCAARRVGDELEIETDADKYLDIATFGARRVSMNGESFSTDGVSVARFRGGRLFESAEAEAQTADASV